MTSTHLMPPSAQNTTTQDRPIATVSPRRITLGTRLAFFVALTVAVVITVLTIAGARIAKRQIEADLRETARVTAVALADDIELRQEPWSSEALAPVLRDFLNAAADLRSISVFRREQANAVPLVHTSLDGAAPTAVVEHVIATGESAWSETPQFARIVVPIHRDDVVTGAVAVAVSLGTVAQLQRTTGVIAAVGAVFGIGAITLLIHLLAHRLILDPLSELRRVTARARAGDLAARAHVTRNDEMQEVADGLNAMLADLDDLHHSLRERVATATAEAARAQQLAAVGQTLANIAHQIGTPLNVISGHVQLLRHEITDAPSQRRLRIVEAQAERMASALRNLLEQARPDAERRPVRIGEVLARIGDATRVRLAASHVTLDLQIAEALSSVAGNETQLELALVNLVTNALDAMPMGGGLLLAAEPTEPHGVRIMVRDTGSGIPAEVLPRIFEPWVTTKGAGRGTGLGLSIARDVITGLGGTITVDTTPGMGTTFSIELPGLEPLQQLQ